MTRILTVELDAELRELIELAARSSGTTALEVLQEQVAAVARNWRISRRGRLVLTDGRRDVICLPAEADLPKLLVEELRRRMANSDANPGQLLQGSHTQDAAGELGKCAKVVQLPLATRGCTG